MLALFQLHVSQKSSRSIISRRKGAEEKERELFSKIKLVSVSLRVAIYRS